MTIIIAQIFGLISWLLLLYSYSKEDIDKLLFIQILVCLFDVISYLLLGANAGLLICLLELVKTILYYKTDKDKLIFNVSLIAYVIIAFLTFDKAAVWVSLLPIIGSVIDSYGCSRDSKSANIASIVSNSMWAIYDLMILSYIGAVNDAVVVVCNICFLFMGYSRLMRIDKFRVVKYKYINEKTLKNIHKLDVKKYGEDLSWDQKYQREVFNKNNDSLFVVKYKHDIIGYLNYINITESEYINIKESKTIPHIINLDSIIKFRINKKNYLLIESINVKEEYEKEKTIDLLEKKFISFIKAKYKQRIYINSIIAFCNSEFEKNVLEKLGFTKYKKFDDGTVLYELTVNKIKKFR